MARAVARRVRVRALGLISGGLDSALAAKLLLEQGIEVIGLHLESPTACRSDVREVAAELGIELEVRAKGEEYLKLLRHPRWGYGKNMNPCIDCRHFMFRIGAAVLEELNAQFLFTGEVLGQRPMSQTRSAMQLIDREAGLIDRIVRPLSALHLDPTLAEREGWIDRARLLGIKGRGRHEQLALAERFGLTAHQSPGGGCLLTDPHFSGKLRDLFEHVPEDASSMDDLALLRIGRHVRVRSDLKIVLGRDRAENTALAGFENAARWRVEPDGFGGPTALVCGARNDANAHLAARLITTHATRVPAGAFVRWGEGARLALDDLEPVGEGTPDVLLGALR